MNTDNNSVPNNVTAADNKSVEQARPSNENSQRSKLSLSDIESRANIVKTLDLDTLMDLAKTREDDMQQIHKSIFTQHVNGASPISEKQAAQIEAFVIDHPEINLSKYEAKTETAAA